MGSSERRGGRGCAVCQSFVCLRQVFLHYQKSCFISATWPPELRIKESEHISAKQNLPQGSLLTIWIPGAKQMQSLWPSIWKVYFSLTDCVWPNLKQREGEPFCEPLGPTFAYLSWKGSTDFISSWQVNELLESKDCVGLRQHPQCLDYVQ